jgi:hypothetical protein
MNDNKTIQLNPERQAQREWLEKRIPVTGENETVILPKQFYKNLTDQQFEILVNDIDLNFLIGAKTEKYIRARMKRLKMVPRKHIPTVDELDAIAAQKKQNEKKANL